MRKRTQLVSVISALALLTACGDDIGDTAAEAERSIEQAAKNRGIDLDATVNEDGEIEKVEINRGSSTVGQNLDLPDNFPEDVYVSSSWNVMSTSATPGGFMVQSLSSQDGKAIVDDVRAEMIDQGWNVSGEAETPFPRINFEKENRVANFNVLPNGDSNAIQLMTMTNQ